MTYSNRTLNHGLLIGVCLVAIVALTIIGVHNASLQGGGPPAFYVDDIANCPDEHPQFPGQKCPSPEVICGYILDLAENQVAQCINPTEVTAPTSTTTTNTQVTSSLDGGYILNCFSLADSEEPYCDNEENWTCNRSDTCYSTQHRDTTCTGAGAFTCGDCHSGRQDCAGDAVCEVVTGSTNFPTGANNNYAAGCTAQCDSGYLDCDSGGAGTGNGCEIQNNGTCGTNARYSGCSGGAGNCICQSGYNDCDPGGAGSGNGCEIQNCASCGTNSIYSGCSGSHGNCICQSGYNDCDAGGPGSGNGCEIQNGASCGSNAIYSGCSGSNGNCVCQANFYDCDGSGANSGNGCEVQHGAACTVNSVDGIYDGPSCTCVPDKSYFETGTNTPYSTPDPLLWGTQYGTGHLIQMSNGSGDTFIVRNDGTIETGGDIFIDGTINGVDITSILGESHLLTTATGGLNVNIYAGNYRLNGDVTYYSGASEVAVNDNTTNYLYFTSAGLQISESGFPTTPHIPTAEVVTSGGSIIAVHDRRILQHYDEATGGGGSGSGTVQRYYHPSYEGVSYVGDGSNNVGQLFVAYDNSTKRNYYSWTSSRSGLNDYIISVPFPIPLAFDNWSDSYPLTLTYRTTNASTDNNKIDIEVYDTAGSLVTLSGSTTSLANTSWTTSTIEFTGSPTWIPGENGLIRISVSAKDSYQAHVREFTLKHTE